jgi:hypothetical protein
MSDAELETKFHALAGLALTKKKQSRVVELVAELEKLERVTPLLAAMRAK